MSSILEALRELEGERPPALRREIPSAEPPRTVRRAAGAFIPVLGGLAVGVLAFVLYAIGPRLMAELPRDAAPTEGTGTIAGDTKATEPPSWLGTAEPPRARVNPGTAPAPERPAVAPSRPTTPAPSVEAAAGDGHDAPRATSGGGQVAVESIAYSANAAERVATLRIHGRRVSLRQRESADGIEVQLILPNGVYVQRGGEVYLLPVSR